MAAQLKRVGPETPKPEYRDSWLDRLLLREFNRRVVAQIPGGKADEASGDYDEVGRCELDPGSKAPPSFSKFDAEKDTTTVLAF